MEALTRMYIILAVIFISILIYFFGPAVMSALADESPGYVAQNIAFTIDAVAGAPENTYVEYDVPEDKVAFIWFKDGEVRVSRYDMCEYGWNLIKEGAKSGDFSIGGKYNPLTYQIKAGKKVLEWAGWAVAEPPQITGQVVNIPPSLTNLEIEDKWDEMKKQFQIKDYHKTSAIHYDFQDQGGTECRDYLENIGLGLNMLWGGSPIKCDAVFEIIYQDQFFYGPSIMLFEKEYLEGTNTVRVDAEC